MSVLDADPVVGTQGAQSAAALAEAIFVPVQHHGVEHGAAPPSFGQTAPAQISGLGVENRQVVVELHPDQRHTPRAGRDHHRGDHLYRITQRHTFCPRPFRRDSVHLRRSGGNSPPGIDQARNGRKARSGHQCHERVGHRHVVETVDACRLEIKPQHFTHCPISHGSSVARGCITGRDPPARVSGT